MINRVLKSQILRAFSINANMMSFKATLMVSIAALSFSLSMPAEALTAKDAAKKVLGFIAGASKSKICRQGDATKGVFSVRSFSGVACQQKNVAAFALKTCKGFEDFDDSGCAKNAKKALGGVNVDKALGDELAIASKDDKEAICSGLDPEDMTPKQAKECASVKEKKGEEKEEE